MKNDLFTIGSITIHGYGLMIGIGIIAAYYLAEYRANKRGMDGDMILSIAICGVVCGILGAKLLYYVSIFDEILANPKKLLDISDGFVVYGGIIGGVLVCRMYKLDAWTIADLAVIGAPLALCLGRCANFVNGELWGKPTDLPWGVIFGGTAGDMPRHPSQLYEAFLEGIVLFCILQVLSRKKPLLPQGTFMGVFVMGYGIVRFLIEFVRVPDAQLGYLLGGVITMGQLLSLPLVIAGLALVIFALRHNRPQRIYLDA